MQTLEQYYQKGSPTLSFIASKDAEKIGDSNANFIGTNLAMQYLALKIAEENEKGHSYFMTGNVSIPDNSDATVLNVANVLERKYQQILDAHVDVEGIYTVLNASVKLGSIAHQNWIFFNAKNMEIIRFEPNGSKFDDVWTNKKRTTKFYEIFRFRDVINILAKSLGVKKVKFATEKTINTFNGCRATSTLLVLINLMNLDVEKLQKLGEHDTGFLTLAIALSDEINKCESLKFLPREKRGEELQTIVSPKTSRKSKSSKKSPKKSKSPEIPKTSQTPQTPQTSQDFSSLTREELKSLLKSRGVSFDGRASKQSLLEFVSKSMGSF